MFFNKKREDVIDFTMNVDEKLTDTTVLEKGDNTLTYADVKEHMPMVKQEPIRALVYWDDICQLTSIGLLEVVNALCESNAKIDIEHFLSRPNEYCYGIDYVYKLYENVIPKDKINEIKKTFYWQIMQISLKTALFAGIMKIDTYFDKLGFYFPYKFPNANKLKVELRNIFFKDTTEDKLKFYYAEDGKSFNSLLLEGYNSIVTPNISETYGFIMKSGLKRITILGPDAHNGVTPEMEKLFIKYRKFPKPNYCEVSLFPEQVTT